MGFFKIGNTYINMGRTIALEFRTEKDGGDILLFAHITPTEGEQSVLFINRYNNTTEEEVRTEAEQRLKSFIKHKEESI